MTHEPNWLLDWYWNDATGKNISHLIHDHLRGVGSNGWGLASLHASFIRSIREACIREHLLVNGCGGAFLHPTHVFSGFNSLDGVPYESKASYPSFEDSSRIALGNILKFRKKNWQFDFIGGIIYFILPFHVSQYGMLSSICLEAHMYPQPGLSFFYLLLSPLCPQSKEESNNRHSPCFCTPVGCLDSDGYHTLYEWYRSVESEHFPDPTGLRARIEQWTFGLYPACIKYLMSAFDIPEVHKLRSMCTVKVPKEWKLDPSWEGESKLPQNLSHRRKFPSKWRSASSQQDPLNTVRIVDQFVIERTVKPEFSSVNGSVTH
ncbi:UNVERIFIED_CONTAM: hypothetical protein Sradi_5132600 [Sesamum radiatum]|uniref:Uncharacterized protein n=1 Tax=Sesamum radiatum TaxID=300843 RepID=A0AAW2M3F8_SESRA